MLNLNDKTYLSSGEKRDVHIHPEFDDRCIKVEKPSGLNSNKIEYRFFKKYRASKALPHFYGIKETNLGKGLVVELVRDHDGKVSKSIKEYLDSGELSIEEAHLHVEAVKSDFIANSVLIHDHGLQNILLKKTMEGSFTPIMIDGFGPRELNRKTIFKVMFPFLARSKSRKVFKQMSRQIA